MTHKAPGKSYREGLSLVQIAAMFSDQEKAREWLEQTRWPDGPVCPHCGSQRIKVGVKHKSMTHRCNDCKRMFSVKVGTVMQGSRLDHQKWAIAIYLFTTNLKGISSMKLHRELGIGQKAAWYMLHRLREAYAESTCVFSGPVEADETYIGGKEGNKHKCKRIEGARGPVGKTAVAGVKDRQTNRISAAVVDRTDARTLQAFVTDRTETGTQVYTDEAAAYVGIDRPHEAVKHSVGEYVRDMAHTNGLESFWSMLKRGYMGTFHHFSEKHLDRYVTEFAGRHNDRPKDTIDQMASITRGMVGKRLRYKDLIADNGRSAEVA